MDRLRADIAAARVERSRLHDAWMETSGRYHDLRMKMVYEPDNQEMARAADDLADQREQIDAQSEKINADIDAWLDELKKEASLYHRPSGWWQDLISRRLGPPPADLEHFAYDEEEFSRVPSRWWLAILTFTAVVAGLIAALNVVPFGDASPLNLAIGSDLSSRIVMGLLTGLVILILWMRVTGRLKITGLFYALALEEELWFRAGAEKWTVRQRLMSCVLFGLVHLINLFYVLATLGMLAIAGAVFMCVYLYEHRSTGDVRRSVIAATKVHAEYNSIAFWLAAIAVGAYWYGELSRVFN